MLLTIKNGDLYAMGNAPKGEMPPLAQLLELTGIPARVQIRLVRLVKLLGDEVNNLIEVRNKYVRLYGEDKGNGNFSIQGPNDEGLPVSPNWEKYKKEMEDLLAQSTKLDCDRVILPADLQITGRLLMQFEAFIEIEEEDISDNGKTNEPVPLKGHAK